MHTQLTLVGLEFNQIIYINKLRCSPTEDALPKKKFKKKNQLMRFRNITDFVPKIIKTHRPNMGI